MNDKRVLYQRCPELMGRKMIFLEETAPNDVISFIDQHSRFVGKRNYGSCSERFHVYAGQVKNLLRRFEKDKVEILEEYIPQHSALNHIFDGCVNTIRIHTARNSKETRVFLKPKLRVGCDRQIADIGCGGPNYRLYLGEGGRVDFSVYSHYKIRKANRHKNSKVDFRQLVIPFLEEAKQICIRAAECFPEIRYIAWDVAITESGPVLVEGNGISGAIHVYQIGSYLATGDDQFNEINEMLEYAQEVKPYFSERKHNCIVHCSCGNKDTIMVAALLRENLHRNNVMLQEDENKEFEVEVTDGKLELNLATGDNLLALSFECKDDIYEMDRKVGELVLRIMEMMEQNPILLEVP